MKRWVKRGKWLAKWVGLPLMLFGLVGLVGFVSIKLQIDLGDEAAWIEVNAWLMALWRLAMIAAIVTVWPWVVTRFARLRGESEDAIAALRVNRWHCAIALLLVELVLVQGVGHLGAS